MSRLRAVLGAATAVVAASCTVVRGPVEPPSVPAPVADVRRPGPEAGGPAFEPSRPEEGPGDPILDAPWVDDPRFAGEVEQWIDFWTGAEGEWFPVYLERMASLADLVDRTLARRGLPPSLRYLPVIESGYAPTAVSRAAAVGLWQLMAPTARSAGMRVGALVDERRDPVRSTEVATAYLAELHDRFGSWPLALAAYNAGPSRVARLLRRRAPGAEPSDELYWIIRDDLPRETRAFVPRFVAAARIAMAPGAYGVAAPRVGAPLAWEEVRVPDATSLDVVARAAGVSEDEVVRLNPQILRSVTPDGVATTLRVPRGAAARFDEAYPLIPPSERVTVREHVVERGDTLWDIARRYGVSVAVLEEANPEVRPERLRPGDRLLVPLLAGGGSGR